MELFWRRSHTKIHFHIIIFWRIYEITELFTQLWTLSKWQLIEATLWSDWDGSVVINQSWTNNGMCFSVAAHFKVYLRTTLTFSVNPIFVTDSMKIENTRMSSQNTLIHWNTLILVKLSIFILEKYYHFWFITKCEW